MSIHAELLFYTLDPNGIFSATVGGFANWTGASAPDGNATIFDAEAGTGGAHLDDDSAGGEIATADVYTPGGTSIGAAVDAELSWTLRDTVTGEVFQVVQFEVATGGATGLYTLSEIPLVAGRSYETLDHSTNPDGDIGDPAFAYADYDYDAYSVYSVTAPSGTGTVDGTSGSDTIDSGYSDAEGDGPTTGDDTIIAGAGNDTIYTGSGSDVIYAGTGDDFVDASTTAPGNDTIYGGAGNDTLQHDIYADIVDGGDGDDYIVNIDGTNSSGMTTVVGGAGTDTYALDTSEGAVFTADHMVNLSTGEVTYLGDTRDLISSIENVEIIGNSAGVTGDSGNNVITATGTFDNRFTAGAGNDTVDGGGGNDTLYGGSGADSIDGGAGDDSVRGDGMWLISSNYVSAGGAATNLTVTNSAEGPIELWWIEHSGSLVWYATIDPGDTVVQPTFENDNWVLRDPDGFYLHLIEGGNQTVDYGAEGLDDTIHGGDGDDTITAGFGDDFVDGGADADTFIFTGGFGNDTIAGGETTTTGADADTIDLSGATGSVTVTYTGDEAGTITDGTNTITFSGIERQILTEQADVVDATADNAGVVIDAGAGNDSILAGSGDDQIDGGDGADTLAGGSGKDTLTGGSGNDALTGGSGNDTLTGGDGDDTFVYSVGDGADTITDFNTGNTGPLGDGDTTNNDFIDLSGFYDSLVELREDFDDDGVLNQSNAADYSDNAQMGVGDSLTFQGADRQSFTADNTGVVCFAAGTMILTPGGAVPVELLKPGDLVVTRDNGPQPILWHGYRHIGRDRLARMAKHRPVWVSPRLTGATAPLIVSPQHGLLLRLDGEERLVRAIHLARTAGGGARVMRSCREVAYHHLMFAAHQIVFANGASSESFYPGPWALRALGAPARDDMSARFKHSLTDVAQGYGAPARSFMPVRNLPDTLRAFTPAPT